MVEKQCARPEVMGSNPRDRARAFTCEKFAWLVTCDDARLREPPSCSSFFFFIFFGGEGIIVCLMQRFEYIIVLSILFIITENIFAMPFSPLVVKKPLVKRFLCRFKGRWGCSGCWNRWWKWLSPPTRVSNRWFHHRYVTLARSDNSFSLKPHGKNYLLHMKSEEDKRFIKIVEIDQI